MEADVSPATVYRSYLLVVGHVGKILLSEVKAKREAHFGGRERKLTDAVISDIQRLYDEGHSSLDIAFLTGHRLTQVEKYNPEQQPRQEATQDTD